MSQPSFLHPRPASAPQILPTGFLEGGGAGQSFEIGERCCLPERSEAAIRGSGNGAWNSSEAPRVSHVWG